MEYGPRATLEILQGIQKILDDRQINPEHFEGRIIFMSTFNDWTKKGNAKICPWNCEQVKNYAKRFQRGHWSSSGQETKTHGLGRTTANLEENGIALRKTWWRTSRKRDTHFSEVSVR